MNRYSADIEPPTHCGCLAAATGPLYHWHSCLRRPFQRRVPEQPQDPTRQAIPLSDLRSLPSATLKLSIQSGSQNKLQPQPFPTQSTYFNAHYRIRKRLLCYPTALFKCTSLVCIKDCAALVWYLFQEFSASSSATSTAYQSRQIQVLSRVIYISLKSFTEIRIGNSISSVLFEEEIVSDNFCFAQRRQTLSLKAIHFPQPQLATCDSLEL